MVIDDIKTVYVHWSESEYINEKLGCDQFDDINKEVDKLQFDRIIKEAAPLVGIGFDKTSLTITMHNGEVHDEIKFYLTGKKNGLIELIKDSI